VRISVFGLGYVGTVSAGCLARDGHTVLGVDPNTAKVDLVNAGRSPIIESEIGDIIARACRAGRLRATTDALEAVRDTEVSILCIGTPSDSYGGPDLRFVQRACVEIGAALRDKADFHVVVARSTMTPGSTRGFVIPTLEAASGKQAGAGFGVCYHPEFLREATAVHDFDNPAKVVFGATDPRAASKLHGLYNGAEAQLRQVEFEAAELIKYVDNAWHALKVCFANEVGVLAQKVGVDGRSLMEIFCSDTALNISAKYLRPGFAFGGSCLPKDVRAVTRHSRRLDLELPVIGSIAASNALHIERALSLIQAQGAKDLGFLGISFKAGTDDLRESPVVELIERLLGKGYNIRMYDRYVGLARLTGANRDYILNHIPHLSEILEENIRPVLDHARVVVVGNQDYEYRTIATELRPDQVLIDLAGICDPELLGQRYHGICW
jgi:GDP-mannose 6-dehydrogenase